MDTRSQCGNQQGNLSNLGNSRNGLSLFGASCVFKIAWRFVKVFWGYNIPWKWSGVCVFWTVCGSFLALARAILEHVFTPMVPLLRKARYAKNNVKHTVFQWFSEAKGWHFTSFEASLQHWASIFFRSTFWVRFWALLGVDFGAFLEAILETLRSPAPSHFRRFRYLLALPLLLPRRPRYSGSAGARVSAYNITSIQ